MQIDPRTPVLVGVGALTQKSDDPRAALEPIELMIAACERAANDAGAHELLRRADSIRVPRGFWDYADPGRLIAQRIGASARTQLAEIGVLQTTLFGDAVRAIASGEEDVVIVSGGEAKYRALRAQMDGVEAPQTQQLGVEPDSVLRPAQEIWSQREADLGLLMPVNQYSIMENALRYAEGLSLEQHRREIAEMWAEFSRVAADNPDAWSRKAVRADEIAAASERNRMLAFPYTKLHNSQWNVDQAAALIFCSVATAEAAGIARDKWIFPLAVVESNHMLPLSQRAEMHRSYGFRVAAARALELAQLRIEEVSHFELYSCFPIAVRMQQRDLGLPPGRALTMTGGMAFAGGPLNNFVLQAAVKMVQILRRDGSGCAMVNAVSGMLTKQGVSLWSTRPPAAACRFEDVAAEVRALTKTCEVIDGYQGAATVASYTVLYDNGLPARAVYVCDIADGRRTLAASDTSDMVHEGTQREMCGRKVSITGDGIHLID